MEITQDLKNFLIDNGFEVDFANSGKVRYTYGTPWTHITIKGEVWPLMFYNHTPSNKWYCYMFGLLMPQIPSPHELMVVLTHMKARGI